MKKLIASALAITCITLTASPVLAATLNTDSAQTTETVEKTQTLKKKNKTNSIKTLLENGTISQNTYDAITAYLSENKTEKQSREKLTEEERAVRAQKRETASTDSTIEKVHFKNKAKTSDGTSTEITQKSSEKKGSLFSKLLEADVITQTEYDTIIMAIYNN